MKNNLLKVAVIGPESTGKSKLCAELAAHYNSYWCPEFARSYLLENGKEYTFDTLHTIAVGQLKQEDNYIAKSIAENKTVLFIDTEMYIMKVWYEYAFNRCPYFVLEEIVRRKYDFYLLANTDLPWEKDKLREYPDPESRQQLFHNYRDILINQNTDWALVSGTGNERLQNAIECLGRDFFYKYNK